MGSIHAARSTRTEAATGGFYEYGDMKVPPLQVLIAAYEFIAWTARCDQAPFGRSKNAPTRLRGTSGALPLS